MRPYWGMPVEAWTAADPEFWKANPMPAFLTERFAPLSAEEARVPGPDGGFSPVEQCWHLADLEREGFGTRIRHPPHDGGARRRSPCRDRRVERRRPMNTRYTKAWKTSFESRTPRSVSRRHGPQRSISRAAKGAESPVV